MLLCTSDVLLNCLCHLFTIRPLPVRPSIHPSIHLSSVHPPSGHCPSVCLAIWRLPIDRSHVYLPFVCRLSIQSVRLSSACLLPAVALRLTMLLQAVASIMYLGLNCVHCMGPVWSPFSTTIFTPVSVFQQCTLPSVDPNT